MRILFCSLATPGLLHPSIGLALTLQRRGHQVAFVTHSSAGDCLESVGLERISRGAQDGDSFQVELWGVPLSIAIQARHIEHALQVFQPDLLVGQQLALGPFVVADRQRLPIAVLGMAAYIWPFSEALLHRLPATDQERRHVWRYGEMMRIYNEARALFRLPPSQSDFRSTPLLGDLFLLQSTAALEGEIGSLPEQVHLVGPCLWEPPEVDPELESWLGEIESSGESLIYLHHGRSFGRPSLWPRLVEALTARPVRVAASTLRMEEQPDSAPRSFFLRRHIPQTPVLRRARGVIATGNTTVVLGALLHGLPLLLSADGGEQKDVSERCQKAGVAIPLPAEDAETPALVRALDELLGNPDLRRRAECIQRALQAEGGAQRAADLVEQMGRCSGPVLRRDLGRLAS